MRANEVRPADIVGVNKDSYIVLEKLPAEFDSRVKAMEVDEKPTEDYRYHTIGFINALCFIYRFPRPSLQRHRRL